MKVIADGLATEYSDEGTGPVMLMLHGWGNTRHSFDALCRGLPSFRMIRLDLPGFGESERPSEPWDVAQYATFVALFCEKLGIVPDILLGHSLGGRIITKGVATGVLSAPRLILIASAGVANRNTLHNRTYGIVSKIGKALLSPLPRSTYESIRRAIYARSGSDYLTVAGMSESFLKVINEDLSGYAGRISTPTLLIWGTLDVVTPLTEGEKLHGLIQGSILVTLPHGTHFVHLEFPKDVAGHIREFCL